MLQGFENKSLAADRGLPRLSHLALAEQVVREIIETHDDWMVLGAIENNPAAQPFLAELRAYLDEYDGRAERWNEIVAPSWIEDPATAIRDIKAYMRQPFRDTTAESERWRTSVSDGWPRFARPCAATRSRW